jgi:hypothetical protein
LVPTIIEDIRQMADATPPPSASLATVVDWRRFLADYPPGTRAMVEGALEFADAINTPKFSVFE